MRSDALFRVTPYVKRHAYKITFAIALAFVEILAETRIPEITGQVVDRAIVDKTRPILPLIALLVVLGISESALAFWRRNVLARVANSLEKSIRDDLYAHLQSLHVSFHDGWQSGQLLSRAMNDLSSIRRFIGWGLPFLVILSFQFIWVVSRLFAVHPVLATITAVGILPVGIVSNTFGRKYRVVSRKVQDQQGETSTVIEESASGIRIIKAFGRRAQMERKFGVEAEKLREYNMGWVKLAAWFWPMFDVVPNLVMGLILIVGGFEVINGTSGFTLGELTTFVLLVQMLVWPVDALGWILAMAEECRTATERIFEVLDTKPQIADRPDAKPHEFCTGGIEMQGVWFKYEGSRDWVLRDVDLSISPGETLALVGKTGSGKTTLAMLIPRLYDVNEGSVKLDGIDVRDMTIASLRSHIGVAFEDPILFSASIRENLIMGRPQSTEEEIAQAIETAQASFVYELPWGLDTRVGEQGHTLSGGQRQRLALARAVLGQPKVLVLDDPLSSVDVQTEALIEEALERVLSGVTAILVVHRPSTLALADRVALIDEGSIVAVGTHHDLMQSEPLYRAVLSQEAEHIGEEMPV